tara:strand:- start:134 stop:577 length:444 start_codon:yes stop_codon:yes gene_type:complete
MPIKTFKGQLPIGQQEKIHLSTNDGLTGYQIKKFKVFPSQPGQQTEELIAQIYLTDQTGNVTSDVNFNQSDFLGVAFYTNNSNMAYSSNVDVIVFDKETFNQDIFVYITNAAGGTTPANFYLELEQFKIDINTSTYHTLKNIRNSKQ